ncbi:J domain-containing protein [Rubrivirga sp. IMCC43871]|uniref:J domain-containing protein n=1 Tax=Rubrivirga sp. IMCC43871 TaxID=3391575 RepID=UPI00398FFF15
MSLVTIGTALAVAMLLVSVVGGWLGDLKRAGGSISARESRAAADGSGRAFYSSREARIDAMRERIHRERMRREKARGPRVAASASGPEPRPDRAPVRPPSPEAVHRAVLDLPAGPVTADVLRVHYRRLVVAYHPDRCVGLGAKLQRLAEEETKSINEAYAFFKRQLGD